MLHHKSNLELLKDFDQRVHGHTEAKKALINLVNRSKIRHHQKWIAQEPKENWAPIGKCLLIGPSGTGKTFLVETLRDMIFFPMITVDATKFNPTGADKGLKADDLAKMIRDNATALAAKNNGYCNSVQGVIDQTVIFVDEVDKLASKWSTGKWNEHVQACFLTMFEDKKDFESVSFIFAGAFSGLDLTKQSQKHSIGFNAHHTNKASGEIDIDAAIIDYGLIPEFVGRMNNIVQLDTLTLDDYRSILNNKLIPAKYRELSYAITTHIGMTDEEKDKVVNKAFKSGQGVRSLKRELDKMFFEHEFHLEYVQKRSLTFDEFVENQSSVFDFGG